MLALLVGGMSQDLRIDCSYVPLYRFRAASFYLTENVKTRFSKRAVVPELPKIEKHSSRHRACWQVTVAGYAKEAHRLRIQRSSGVGATQLVERYRALPWPSEQPDKSDVASSAAFGNLSPSSAFEVSCADQWGLQRSLWVPI